MKARYKTCIKTEKKGCSYMNPINAYIDHTNLKPYATEADIRRLCAEAAEARFASVCVNPCYVSLAKHLLSGTHVNVCTVIGFPLGANNAAVKIAETEDAYRLGCDEFDMVISVGALKDGRLDYVRDEIRAAAAAAKGKIVKVIIETGLLTDAEKAAATKLACEGGAAYVKTCTGVSAGAATIEGVRLIKAHLSGGVKIKASGGIKTYEAAKALIAAGAERLGTSSGLAIMEAWKQCADTDKTGDC